MSVLDNDDKYAEFRDRSTHGISEKNSQFSFCWKYTVLFCILGNDEQFGEFCGTSGIPENSPIITNSNSVRVDFDTDDSGENDGFIFYYMAVGKNLYIFGFLYRVYTCIW